MPSTKTIEHNGLVMTFNEGDHSYVDSKKRRYTSVTTLVGYGFQPFDAEGVAKRKDKDNWQKLMAEWKQIGETAASNGTRLHENCENQILGRLDMMHAPRDIAEKMNFDAARTAVDELLADDSFESFEPEKLVFCDKIKLAGSVDLLARRKDKSYAIFDWKCVKSIDYRGFGGKTGILEATKDIPDSNFWHYALQLSLYEIILKIGGYVERDATFTRRLNVISNGSFKKVELPDMREAAKKLIVWLNRR